MLNNEITRITYKGPILAADLVPLPIPFSYDNNADITLLKTNALSEQTILTLTTDHTITNNNIYLINDLLEDETVTVYRATTLDQQRDFMEQGKYRITEVEKALDKLTMQNQEQKDSINRSLKVPINTDINFKGEIPIPTPGRAIVFSEDGLGLSVSALNPDTAVETIQGYVATVSEQASASIASALASESSAIAASISAASASTSAATILIPPPTGNGLNYLRQKSTEDGFEYRTPAQVIEDIDVQTHINNVLDGFFPINGFEIHTIETQLTGTVSTTSGSATLTGSGTLFTTEAPTGTQLLIGGESYSVSSVASNTSLTLSSNAVSTLSAVNYHSISNSISVSSGKCRDITDSINIQTSTTLIKKLGVNWVAGNNQGGFIPVSGHTSKEALTQYNVFAVTIPSGGTNDICMIHRSACDGEYLTPEGKVSMAAVMGWTEDELYYRRIACLRTGFTGNIIPVTQFGDRFDYKVRIPARALSASSDTLGHLWGIYTPYGIKTEALINGFVNVSGTSYLNLQNPEEIDILPDATSSILSTSSGSFNVNVVTNTASQIRYRTSNTSFTFSLNLKGYIDRRGKK